MASKRDERKEVSRREFLKVAAGTFALGAVSGFKPSRTYALAGSQRVIGANERINIGIIGCGGMGHAHMRTLVSAIQRGEENAEIVAVWQYKHKGHEATSGKKHKSKGGAIGWQASEMSAKKFREESF